MKSSCHFFFNHLGLPTPWIRPNSPILFVQSPSLLTLYSSVLIWTQVNVNVTLRLAVYRQSIRLGVKLLETHDQRFFQLNSCGNSPYLTPSLARRWVSLLWSCLAFRQEYISLINHVIEKFFLLHYTEVSATKGHHQVSCYAKTVALYTIENM
jgi:hypothetical protein